MQQAKPLFNRPDTLLGVCEGIGQDFGFNPNYLRVALAVLVLWNPVAMIAAYLALGVAVMISRLLAPARSAARDLTLVERDDADMPNTAEANEAPELAAAA